MTDSTHLNACQTPRATYFGRRVPCERPSCPSCWYLLAAREATIVLDDAALEPPTVVATLEVRSGREADLEFAERRLWRVLELPRRRSYREWSRQPSGAALVHTHVLLKVADGQTAAELAQAIEDAWSAGPARAEVVRDVAAAVGYAAGLGGGKHYQRPPVNWRGRRVRGSANYFAAARARQEVERYLPTVGVRIEPLREQLLDDLVKHALHQQSVYNRMSTYPFSSTTARTAARSLSSAHYM